MNQSWTRHPHDGKTCIQVTYRGPVPGGVGWAGVYWQSPVDNWGTVPGPTGYNLSRATRLTFWVRGTTGPERVQFLVGGITGKYGDSLQPAVKTQVLTLSTTWQQVTIDLSRNGSHPHHRRLRLGRQRPAGPPRSHLLPRRHHVFGLTIPAIWEAYHSG